MRHARHRLKVAAGPETARAIERQLRSDGARSLRSASLGSAAARAHALASAVTVAGIAAEHRIESSSAAALLGLAARWLALAHAELDAAATANDADRSAAVSRARYGSVEFRLALLGALETERRARDTGQRAESLTVVDIAGAVAAAERAARAAEPAGLDDEDEDEPDGDDEGGVETPDTPREGGKPEGRKDG